MDLPSDEPTDGVFAILDVLGLRDRMQSMRLTDVRDLVVGALVSSAAHAGLVTSDDRRQWTDQTSLAWACFSDTVILWLPAPEQRARWALESVVYTCQMMLAKSMWLNVPLRGAIAYGECVVSLDPIYYLGLPILEAHSLEHCQQWAGVALCTSAERVLDAQESTRILRYDAPLKSPTDPVQVVPTSTLVVDWPACSLGPRMKRLDPRTGEPTCGPSPDWNVCFASSRVDVTTKREWTERFFNSRDEVMLTGGATFGPEQREHVGSWRELYRGR